MINLSMLQCYVRNIPDYELDRVCETETYLRRNIYRKVYPPVAVMSSPSSRLSASTAWMASQNCDPATTSIAASHKGAEPSWGAAGGPMGKTTGAHDS